MATVQNNNIEFVIGDKAKISTADAYKLWFDTTHKQIILKGVEFIPKKLSELTNDSGFISSITKAMVEGVLTGTISSHTHTFSSITSKPTTLSGYGITDAALASDLSKYLPLTGGTLTGNLTCNGSYINMNGDSGAKGFKGYFNQSGTEDRASGSHIFMYGGGEALGTNSVSIGYQAYAGIRNKDNDATTYPYIAWQWMPTEKFMVDTTNSATLSGGEYYGFPLLPNEMVRWSIGGQNVIYENSSSYKELLVVIKGSDEDTGLIFGGKTSLPYRASKTLIAGKYIIGSGEYLKKIDEYTINDVKYYQVIIYTWNATAFPTSYDFTQQVKVMCATKVNNSNYNGASSYASGSYSVASGAYSVASGAYSVASGNYSVASGNYSVASGYYSVASGAYSVASGYYSVASGNYSVASGYYSVASGNYSVASGNYTVATGAKAKAKHSYSFVAGYRCSSGTYFQTVIGRTNLPTADAFVIGNGSSDQVSDANAVHSNCFAVDWSGNVTGKSFSGYSNSVGGEGFKIYPENSNEINFGGTSSNLEIIFGKSSKDNRPVPTTYKFGANGDATIQAASFLGNASTASTANTASQLATPRTLTIGNTGKTFDGTADVSWTLEEIGAKDENVKYTTSVDNVDYRLTAIGQRIAGNVEGTNGVVTADGVTMNPSTGNLKATSFTGSLIGNADTATALTSSAGSSTQPIYFSNGKPVACSYTLAKSVPSNAVFTDTTYSVATATADGLMSSEMFNAEKVSSINVRQGAATFEETVSNHDIYVTYNKDDVLNSGIHAFGGDVQIKIPNATTDYDGSMSYLDKRKLTNIQDGCIAASVYVMTINYDALLDLNGIEEPTTNFANLDNIMTSGKFPDMIRLVLNNSIHIFTLYESYLSDKYAQYRCEGRKAEISILANIYVLFSVN